MLHHKACNAGAESTEIPAPNMNGAYVIVVTWARGICLICMPEARGLRAYISGKSREHMLQVICITSDCGFAKLKDYIYSVACVV